MGRKQKHEEHVNHERWLVSYADFITLLFAFFTSLYAISTVDAKKAGQLVFSTRSAFNLEFFPADKAIPGNAPMNKLTPLAGESPKETTFTKSSNKSNSASIRALRKSLNNKALRETLNQMRLLLLQEKNPGLSIKMTKNTVVISLEEALYFKPGKADINQAMLPYLDRLAQRIINTTLDLRVEGHTDETPAQNSPYHSNWELSVARAMSVARYFLEQFAFPPDALSIAGYASYRQEPEDAGGKVETRSRRVDLVLLIPWHEHSAESDPNDLVNPHLNSNPNHS